MIPTLTAALADADALIIDLVLARAAQRHGTAASRANTLNSVLKRLDRLAAHGAALRDSGVVREMFESCPEVSQ